MKRQQTGRGSCCFGGWGRGLGPGLVAAIAGLGLWQVGAWEPGERLAQTALFWGRDWVAPLEWDDRIAVITIDEASLAALGPFPWPRDRYAALLDRLMAVQPAAVGFDILMAESTPEDGEFAQSLAFLGTGVLAVGDDGQGRAIQVTPTVAEPAAGLFSLGHVKHWADPDGVTRRAVLYERHGNRVAPSFAIALLETYYTSLDQTLVPEAQATPLTLTGREPGSPGEDPIAKSPPEAGRDGDALGDRSPLAELERFDQHHPRWINWPGVTRRQGDPAVGPLTLSFAQVLADEGQVLDQLQNRIVLVGYTAVGIMGQGDDAIKTPFERQIPTAGVYFHAAIVDNLLQNRFLNRLAPGGVAGLIGVAGLGTALLLAPLNVKGRLLALAGGAIAWGGIALGGFLGHWWLPVAAPLGTGFLSVVGLQFQEQRERQTLRALFEINLSPQMADLIWQHRGELLQGGQIQPKTLTATLLFMDIRGFTTVAERLESAQLLDWLNRYFEVMTDCIMAHGGVVDKYIGDAIMAAFGAPMGSEGREGIAQDAIAAVNACVAMVSALETLNQEFAAQGLPTVRMGMGLHTGSLVAGTVGSRHRSSYSLFGDTVNVAARIQDLTKTLPPTAPYPLLLSQETRQYLGDDWHLILQGSVQLRGRTEPTQLYTLGTPGGEALAGCGEGSAPDIQAGVNAGIKAGIKAGIDSQTIRVAQ